MRCTSPDVHDDGSQTKQKCLHTQLLTGRARCTNREEMVRPLDGRTLPKKVEILQVSLCKPQQSVQLSPAQQGAVLCHQFLATELLMFIVARTLATFIWSTESC